MSGAKRILFVCVENSNRSQMAEAFARMHGGDRVEALSAGSRPSGRINPRAVRFMAELGYELTAHRSKSLDEIGCLLCKRQCLAPTRVVAPPHFQAGKAHAVVCHNRGPKQRAAVLRLRCQDRLN